MTDRLDRTLRELRDALEPWLREEFLFAFGAGLAVGVALLVVLAIWMHLRHRRAMARVGERTLAASRRVLKGQIVEQLVPLIGECPYSTADMRFLGAPVDYIVFAGYSDAPADAPYIREVVFLEIKTGAARLNASEKALRDAIAAGRVRWETWRLEDQDERDEG